MNDRGTFDPAWQRLKPRGSSQGALRRYNERVVLQAIRLHGALPGAEIARLTRLTAQTVSLISKRLLDEGLVRKGEPLRGKVGQPSVPLSLNPDGAYAIGINVGRRSLDMLLVDFTGEVRERRSHAYRFPDPDAVLPEIDGHVRGVVRALGTARRSRLQGVGIAIPLSIGSWQDLLGFPQRVSARWQATDLRAEVARRTKLPVTVIKDTAAACVAELVSGRGRYVGSFLYIFVGTFIGGGLVMDSRLRSGLHGNAGAVGSMPLGLARGARAAAPAQLLGVASLLNLERAYARAGLDVSAVGDERALQAPWRELTRRWLGETAAAIALAVSSATCLLDLDGVIVDGSFGRDLLAALEAELQGALSRYSWEGVVRPPVHQGTIGADARALGGALLPLYASYVPDRDLFLKMAID